MTNTVTSETAKATGDARVAAQTAYDNSKVPHTTHSDVAKSIHQVKDAGVQAHKVSDDAKYEAQKGAHDEVKVTVATPHKDADLTSHAPSHNPKSDVQKAAPGVKVGATDVVPAMNKK
ncbi:MAG: hypothetical protein WCJ93_02905 [Methanomicrobiales archaeon]